MSAAVLVTGATGFTGINLVRRFAEAGRRVIAVDRVAPDRAVEMFLGEFRSLVEFFVADVAVERWEGGLPRGDVDLVVHAAAITNQRTDEEVPRALDAVNDNAAATLRVVDWALRAKAKRFVYVSSGAPYGRVLDDRPFIDETVPPDPVNVYAVTKFAGERLALRVADLGGLSAAAVRLASHYGPMERATPDRTRLSVPQRWCNAAVRGEPVQVNRAQLPRDYTYIADGADAVYRLAVAPSLRYDLYNISAERSLSCEELLAALRQAVPDLTVRYLDDATPNRADRRPLSAARLREETGWEPRHDVRQAFAAYVGWLRKALDADLRTL